MKPTSDRFGEELTTLVDSKMTPTLRSVVGYTTDAYTVHFIRDDVAVQYNEADIVAAIDELRLETISHDQTNSVFQGIHGKFECRVNVFANAVEYHFIIDDGLGVELAFDREWLTTGGSVVEDVIELLSEHTEYVQTA
jgi:hypothetical protein